MYGNSRYYKLKTIKAKWAVETAHFWKIKTESNKENFL
jgi:hypothetical protein